MTQDEVFCSSQRQNQSFDSLEEEDEEIDVGIEDDSDEEVSRNNSKTIKDSNSSFFLASRNVEACLEWRRGFVGFVGLVSTSSCHIRAPMRFV